MTGAGISPSPRRAGPTLRGLAFRQALVPNVPMLEGPCHPGSPCAPGVTGRRVPRSHGPSEESVNGTKVNIRLPSRPAPVLLERLPGGGLSLDRGRCLGARRAICAILTGAGLPTSRGRCPSAPRAGGAILPGAGLLRGRWPSAGRAGYAIVERPARALPSGDRIRGSSSGKTDDGAGRSPGGDAARG